MFNMEYFILMLTSLATVNMYTLASDTSGGEVPLIQIQWSAKPPIYAKVTIPTANIISSASWIPCLRIRLKKPERVLPYLDISHLRRVLIQCMKLSLKLNTGTPTLSQTFSKSISTKITGQTDDDIYYVIDVISSDETANATYVVSDDTTNDANYPMGDDTTNAYYASGDDKMESNEVSGDDKMESNEVSGDDSMNSTDVSGDDSMYSNDVSGDDTMYSTEVSGDDTMYSTDASGDDTIDSTDVDRDYTTYSSYASRDFEFIEDANSSHGNSSVEENLDKSMDGSRGVTAEENWDKLTDGSRDVTFESTYGSRGVTLESTDGSRGATFELTDGSRGATFELTDGSRGVTSESTDGSRNAIFKSTDVSRSVTLGMNWDMTDKSRNITFGRAEEKGINIANIILSSIRKKIEDNKLVASGSEGSSAGGSEGSGSGASAVRVTADWGSGAGGIVDGGFPGAGFGGLGAVGSFFAGFFGLFTGLVGAAGSAASAVSLTGNKVNSGRPTLKTPKASTTVTSSRSTTTLSSTVTTHSTTELTTEAADDLTCDISSYLFLDYKCMKITWKRVKRQNPRAFVSKHLYDSPDDVTDEMLNELIEKYASGSTNRLLHTFILMNITQFYNSLRPNGLYYSRKRERKQYMQHPQKSKSFGYDYATYKTFPVINMKKMQNGKYRRLNGVEERYLLMGVDKNLCPEHFCKSSTQPFQRSEESPPGTFSRMFTCRDNISTHKK